MNIQYRKLRKEDVAAYRKARLECLFEFPDHFGSSHAEESKKKELKFEDIIRDETCDSYMMGAFDNKLLIGLCGFKREDRAKTKHRGEIVQMYVNKEHANQNIGSCLLKTVIEKAFENPDIEQISLSVVHQNEKANKVYEHLGFSEYGRLENYFKSDTRYWDQRFMILYRDGFKPTGHGHDLKTEAR